MPAHGELKTKVTVGDATEGHDRTAAAFRHPRRAGHREGSVRGILVMTTKMPFVGRG